MDNNKKKKNNIALLLYGLITVLFPILASVFYVSYLQEYIYENIARKYFVGKDFAALADLSLQFGLCLFIVFVGFMIIFFNTIVYYSVNKFDKSRSVLVAIILGLFAYGIWIGFESSDIKHLLDNIPSSTNKTVVFDAIERIITVTNFALIVLYVLLALIDVIEYTNQKDALDKDFSKRQLFYVDIPVISGLIMIMVFILCLRDETLPSKSASFHVFSAGANGMQMYLSQLIFLIINIGFYRNKYKKPVSCTSVKS